jgi:hypothetical protein
MHESVRWLLAQSFFALFTLIAGAWAAYCWQQREHAHRIHALMGVLCFFKALTLMSQAGEYHFVRFTGHPDGWNVAYYIFTFCRGVLFFTVVVLIGTGWSYMVRWLAHSVSPLCKYGFLPARCKPQSKKNTLGSDFKAILRSSWLRY